MMGKRYEKDLGVFRYEVELHTDALIEDAMRAAQAAVNDLGEYIRAESTAIAPLREGPLTESAAVTPGSKPNSVFISYDKPYARIQHERTDFKHPNGRQALYLKSVMDNPATAQRARDLFSNHLNLK